MLNKYSFFLKKKLNNYNKKCIFNLLLIYYDYGTKNMSIW